MREDRKRMLWESPPLEHQAGPKNNRVPLAIAAE